MEVEMSLPWPAGIPQLKRLDELLRCGICYEFMSTSMVTLCSHNYCSLCIRQYLSYKTQCPACFKETTNQHLRNNRLIDEIIALFPALRDKVARLSQSLKGGSIAGYFETISTRSDTRKDGEMNAIQTRSPTTTTEAVTPLTSTATPASHSSRVRHEEDVSVASPKPARGLLQSPSSEQTILETPKRTIGQEKKSGSCRTLSRGGQMDGPSSSSSPSPFLLSPSSSRRLKSPIGSGGGSQLSATHPAHTPSSSSSVSGYFCIRSDSLQRSESNEGGGRGAEDGERVPCPVCHVEVPQRNINIHLDACLKSVDQGDDVVAIAMREPKRKALPKLVYSLLNDKQLKQKMREAGLSVLGDRTTLINRHKRYTTLYNAECDVSEPRSAAELVRQVEKEEREKIKATTSIFNYDRKTAPELIEKEQTAYLKKNNNHFASLIADIKQRQAVKNVKNSSMRHEEEGRDERKKGGSGNKLSPEKSNKEDTGKRRKGGVRKGQREVLPIEDSDDGDEETVRKGRRSNRLRTVDRDEKEFCEVKRERLRKGGRSKQQLKEKGDDGERTKERDSGKNSISLINERQKTPEVENMGRKPDIQKPSSENIENTVSAEREINVSTKVNSSNPVEKLLKNSPRVSKKRSIVDVSVDRKETVEEESGGCDIGEKSGYKKLKCTVNTFLGSSGTSSQLKFISTSKTTPQKLANILVENKADPTTDTLPVTSSLTCVQRPLHEENLINPRHKTNPSSHVLKTQTNVVNCGKVSNNTAKEREKSASSDVSHTRGKLFEDDEVDSSPDLFPSSPASLVGSERSVSLLVDTEPLSPSFLPVTGEMDSDGEELIPARQPGSTTPHCKQSQLDDTQLLTQPMDDSESEAETENNRELEQKEVQSTELSSQGKTDHKTVNIIKTQQDLDFYEKSERHHLAALPNRIAEAEDNRELEQKELQNTELSNQGKTDHKTVSASKTQQDLDFYEESERDYLAVLPKRIALPGNQNASLDSDNIWNDKHLEMESQSFMPPSSSIGTCKGPVLQNKGNSDQFLAETSHGHSIPYQVSSTESSQDEIGTARANPDQQRTTKTRPPEPLQGNIIDSVSSSAEPNANQQRPGKLNPNEQNAGKSSLSQPCSTKIRPAKSRRLKPSLGDLTADTQLLIGDTPLDPNYCPSQELEEYERNSGPSAPVTRRSNRKRKVSPQEAMTVPSSRGRRRRKK